MTSIRTDENFQAEFRAKLYSAQVDSGMSIPQLADKIGMEPASLLSDYFKGKNEMPVSVLHRVANALERPIWWFFGEQPSTISIEAAQNAMTNLSKMRLYVEAVESEFRSVIHGNLPLPTPEPAPPISEERPANPVVVNFAPYLARARAILEQEAECTEDSEEVFEESVELIAQRLYSIDMAVEQSREMAALKGK